MDKKKKLQKIIEGEKVDTLSASFWHHFYNEEQDMPALARMLVNFQETYRWDFLKINPRASYYSEEWGCTYTYSGDGKPKRISSSIKDVDDWASIKQLPIKDGILGKHVELVKLIKNEVQESVPVIQTIFLPLEIAARMCHSRYDMKRYIKQQPELIENALEIITETFIDYAKACLNAGADGFFLATKCASERFLSDEDFLIWHKRFDEKLLNSIAKDARFLILHICGEEIRLKDVINYPVHILHWDSTIRGNPTLKHVHKQTDKVIMGGVSNFELSTLSPEALLQVISRVALPNRWILSAECTLEPPFREQNLHAISDLVRGSSL